MKKLEIPANYCPFYIKDNLSVRCKRSKNEEAHIFPAEEKGTFVLRNIMNWRQIMACPLDFEADESGVPCFCAAPQAREYQESQKPLNLLKKWIRQGKDAVIAELNDQLDEEGGR